MTCPPADLASRRRELREAFRALNSGSGWRVRYLSAWTAHATFADGFACGHVVGTADGWWWGVQDRPGHIGEMYRAASVGEACERMRHATLSYHYKIMEGRKRDGQQVDL